MSESNPRGIITENFYILGAVTVAGVIESIERQILGDPTKAHLIKYEIIRVEITAGLPKCDYGQMAEVSFLTVDRTTVHPDYEEKYKNKLLMGS
jgi:hypothetical protein